MTRVVAEMAGNCAPGVGGGEGDVVGTAFQAFRLPTSADESDDIGGDKFLVLCLRSRYLLCGLRVGMSDIGFYADIRYAILSNSKFSIPISADTDVDIWVIYFSSNLI